MRIAPPTVRSAVVLLLLLSLSASAPSQPAAGRDDARLSRGAELLARGDWMGARSSYLEALDGGSARFTALHRLARVESMLAESGSGEEARTLVASAVEHARAAVGLAPDSAAGHLELAVALGRQALKEGPKTQLSLSREIKSEVDRALAIDPSLGRGWHVLALWNRKLASLNFVERTVAKTVLGGVPKGATMENAVAHLQRAVALEPAYVNHHLELGRTFAQLKRTAEARQELERAAGLTPEAGPLDARYQAEARELLARLKKS